MTGVLLASAWLAIFLFLAHRLSFFQLPGLSRWEISALLLLKVAASGALWAVYTFHYTDRASADLFKYFDDSAIMHDALRTHPADHFKMITGIGDDDPAIKENHYVRMNNWYRQYEGNLYNDSHTMIRYNALLRMVSFGHFSVHAVITAFLAFLGTCAMFRALLPVLPGKERALAAVLFLVPSVLFWCSGVIKESLLLLGLGLLLYSWMSMVRGRIRSSHLALLLFSLYGLLFLKFYVLLCLLPGLVAWTWSARTGHKGAWWKFLSVHLAFVLIGLSVHLVFPGYDVIEILWTKQKDFIGMATGVNAGSFVMPDPLEKNVWSFVAHVPHALYTTLLGPMFHPGAGLPGMVAAVENGFLLVVLAWMLTRTGRVGRDQFDLVLMCLGFAGLLSLVIGWTTPVMGAVVRYRAPMIPFLLVAALALMDPSRMPFRSTPRP